MIGYVLEMNTIAVNVWFACRRATPGSLFVLFVCNTNMNFTKRSYAENRQFNSIQFGAPKLCWTQVIYGKVSGSCLKRHPNDESLRTHRT